MLMTELTKNESKWSASGGYCKLLELNDLAIRWYADSKSLTVNGKLSDDIKSELRNIIIVCLIIVCLIKTSSGSQKTELHDVKCYKVINSKKILYYNAI